MKIALLPEFTGDEREAAKAWLSAVLANEHLTANAPQMPAAIYGRMGLYIDGRFRTLQRGEYWADDIVGNFYVGYRERPGASTVPLPRRLAVIGGIISLAGLWGDLHEAYIARAAGVLIGTYSDLMSGLVRTEAAVSGLAFSADRATIAARIGDAYHLPNGEAIEIDETWTVVPDRPFIQPTV